MACRARRVAARPCLAEAAGHHRCGCSRRRAPTCFRPALLACAAAAKRRLPCHRSCARRPSRASPRQRPKVMADHIIGAVLGGAIGDGWGGPYEGGVPHGPARPPESLVISDDTQLTLAT